MFPFIFALLLTPVLLIKYYELIKYEKLNVKNWVYLILATCAVISIFAEKILKYSL